MTDDSNNDRRPDSFDHHHDDEPTDHDRGGFGQVGTGKTDRLATEFVRRVAAANNTEFIDPKGDGSR